MSERLATKKSCRTACAFTFSWVAAVVVIWLFGAYQLRAEPPQLLGLTVMAYLACWAPFFVVSRQNKRMQAIRFVVANLSLLLALAVVELAALTNLVDYRLVFGNYIYPRDNPTNMLDSELIHIHPPYLHEKGQLMGGDLARLARRHDFVVTTRPYDVRYDRNGFRNDVDYDTANCIVIGDSFVEGGNVSSDELLTHQIAEILGISVVNLGQSMYGPQQELKVFERFGKDLHPNVCVWVFFEGNDLGDVWSYRGIVRDWPNHTWKGKTFARNAFVWLSAKLETFAPRVDKSGLFTSSDGRQRLLFGYAGDKLSARDIEALEIATASIADAHASCVKSDIQLVVVFAPTKFRVYSDFCSFAEDSPIRDWELNDLPRKLSQSIQGVSSEIGFLDLTTELKQSAKNGVILYYPDDTHWSPEGHEVAGRTISQFLQANYNGLLNRDLK
ncbi:MAG: hypothetical protein IID44_01360 [Planctomycetes bacterium]|nr:hypothetical protein [Planctomycetota bacterium]